MAGQYPRWTFDGHYCCDSTPASPQELLDYINDMLDHAIQNTSPAAFQENSTTIASLIMHRKQLFRKYPQLEDDMTMSPEELDEWFFWMEEESMRLQTEWEE